MGLISSKGGAARSLRTGSGLAVAAIIVALGTPAPATTPPPLSGAPVSGSAPLNLTGVSPQTPAGVITASAAPGSTRRPQPATYGDVSIDDNAARGAGSTSSRTTTPSSPSGAPAVESAPSSLTGLSPELPAGVITASAAPGSTWRPEPATYGTASIDDIAVRGTGDSNGEWGLFDPVQQQDAIDVLDWAARLPNSTGSVGTYGPSYLGIDQLLLAGAVGPHSPLKAIFPIVPANDIYRDTAFMGGLVDFEFGETYLGLTGALNVTNPVEDTASDPQLLSDLLGIESDHVNGLARYHAATEANVLGGGDEDYDGTYWQQRNPSNVLGDIVTNGIPAYLVGGEFDLFQNGEPLDFAALQNAYDGRPTTAPMEAGQKTTGRYQLIDGPWEHLNGSSVDVDMLELEWFDTWLKGEHTGMADTPTPLHYYDLGTGAFDETTTYPFTGPSPTTYYFGPGGALRTTPPTSTTAGSDGIVWSPTGSPCGRPVDQWSMGAISIPASEAGILAPCSDEDNTTQVGPWETSYTTQPFGEATTLAGPITATVYATANTANTQWVAEVEEVTPDGTSFPITEGALLGSLRAVDRASSWTADGVTVYPYHPYTQESAKALVPGATEEYQIQIFPTLLTITQGDRLRVTISTTDTPHLVPIPSQLEQLVGGRYQILRTPTSPSSLTVELGPVTS